MDKTLDKLLQEKMSLAEELEICNELTKSIKSMPQKPPGNAEQREKWITFNTKLLVFISKRRAKVQSVKKPHNLSTNVHRVTEALSSVFVNKPADAKTALALIEVYSAARESLAAEPDARKFCCCTLALNFFRECADILNEHTVLPFAAEFLLHGVCDIWSEIRMANVKFIELTVISCNPKLTDEVLSKLIGVLSEKNSDWQAIEGCLMAACGIVESLGSSQGKGSVTEFVEKTKPRIFSYIWPHITHCQICVRESAIRAATAFLVRSSFTETTQCLDTLFTELSGKNKTPEEMEGYITACIEVIKLLTSEDIENQPHDWIKIALDHLSHPATTVRSCAANLAKALVGKHANSPVFLHKLLASLISPLENHGTLPWQEVEGHFIALDSILRILVANHWLYNFTSSNEPPRFGASLPVTLRDDNPIKSTHTKTSLEENADIAAEIVQLSKTQRKHAKYRRTSFFEARKPSISFELMDTVRPVSLLDLCIMIKHQTSADLSPLLKIALFAAATNLDAKQWELRRMAMQVLPYIGETMRWYDMDLFWESITELLNPDSELASSNTAESKVTGRSPWSMAGTLLLQAWLVQSDRICLQIEDKRLMATLRLKEYIFATKGIVRFVNVLVNFCQVDAFDRQTVTSARVLLQFLARTNLVELASSNSECPNVSLLLHTVLGIGVSLMWSVVEKDSLAPESIELAKNIGVDDFKTLILPERAFLMFGSSQLHASVGKDSYGINQTNAKIAVIENILPEIIALLRRFIESQLTEEHSKLQTSDWPKDNIFILVGSLLAPLASLLVIYANDSDLLHYITDSTAVAATALFNCEEDSLYKSAVSCVTAFLEQLCANVAKSTVPNQRAPPKSQHLMVFAASRIAFWGCRLILKHADDPLISDNVEVSVKLSKIIALVSNNVLRLVPKPEETNESHESLKVDGIPWSVVGSGEILHPTPVPDERFDFEDIKDHSKNAATGNDEEESASGDADSESDAFDESEEDIDFENMAFDEDLDELLVEVVTDMRGLFLPSTLENTVAKFSDMKEQELLNYLLL